MKTANYFTGYETKELSILKENKDGTVDLGDDNGTPIVTGCPVSKVEKVGHCIVDDDAKASAKTK